MSSSRLINWLKKDVEYLSTTKEKWVDILGSGLFFSLFMVFFKPFGVTNYDPNFQVDAFFVALMFSFGFVATLFLALLEFVIRPILFKSMSNGKLLVWYAIVIIIIATVSFLFYNLLGNWHDFNLPSYFEFIANVPWCGRI